MFVLGVSERSARLLWNRHRAVPASAQTTSTATNHSAHPCIGDGGGKGGCVAAGVVPSLIWLRKILVVNIPLTLIVHVNEACSSDWRGLLARRVGLFSDSDVPDMPLVEGAAPDLCAHPFRVASIEDSCCAAVATDD